MSEVIGRLNRTIEAQGPDELWVASRDALQAAYETISDLHAERRALIESAAEAKADAWDEGAEAPRDIYENVIAENPYRTEAS